MSRGPTIGVLSTSFGGMYFGGILSGVARVVAPLGGRIITIQTLDAGTKLLDLAEPPDFRHRVAWDHVSAFVAILNCVDVRYLEAIQRAGKPVVMVNDRLPGFDGPVVLPDNAGGIRTAVEHLIAHGHRDIGFAGSLAQQDQIERFTAYRETLVAHGIAPRADLFFNTGNNQEHGGERAGRMMIAAGLPSTAVVTGNDFNAIGLMRVLQAAGYELPREQAVVGYDDYDGVVYLNPSLSTVRQPFDEAGALAAQLLLRHLDGEPPRSGVHRFATSFVARQSCGCPDTLALGSSATDPTPAISSTAELLRQVQAVVAPGRQPLATDADTLRRGVDTIARVLQAAVDDAPGPGSFEVREAIAGLQRLHEHPESLVETMRCVRRYGERIAELDGGAGTRVREGTDELILALAQSQARAQFRDGLHFQSTLNTQYAVSMNLLRSHEEDPRMLTWIKSTHARAGCLGLWPEGRSTPDTTGEPRLAIAAVFERDRQHPSPPSEPVAPRAFPPAEVVELADLAAGEMVFVAPMRVNASDWGMLAIVGPMETLVPTGREMMNQWAALLTIALDHEAVLESLREREERLRYAALYDQLTGLANRTLFLDGLKHAINRARRRSDYRFAVLMLDLDGFKVVNDSLGHLAGDELLVQLAKRLASCIRETDIAARFGGDEFAVLLEDITHPNGPVEVAERINASLAEPFRLGEEEAVLSASIGIALSSQLNSQGIPIHTGYRQPEDMLRDADAAMYAAKWLGKSTYAVFNQDMRAKAVGRLRTEAELRRALELREFELHYQPIVRLDTTETAGFEALIRWQHPTRGMIPPGDFLPIAEDSGMMLPIGRWVLAESCRQLGLWLAADPTRAGLRLSVNISNRQFWHGRLVDDVLDGLRQNALDASALTLEITEGVIMHERKAAQRILAELHEIGVELHIDDFGTGHSSLEALHHLPIDVLKIDRSFVSRLGIDARSGELVRTIVLMGSNLGLDIVAEGIETDQQLAQLRLFGCKYGQGFLFSRAVPAAQAEALINRVLVAATPAV